MSAGILQFHSPALSSIPKPACALEGDVFLRLDVVDDSMQAVGILAGAVLVVLKDVLTDGAPHGLEFSGEIFVGVLTMLTPERVRFDSWQGEHSGNYPFSEIKGLGTLVEIYPKGLSGPRWSLTFPAARSAQAFPRAVARPSS